MDATRLIARGHAERDASPGDVPLRCQRAPNAAFDRSFAIFTCNQRDARCPFHGPTYVLDNDGRRFECRKKAEEG